MIRLAGNGPCRIAITHPYTITLAQIAVTTTFHGKNQFYAYTQFVFITTSTSPFNHQSKVRQKTFPKTDFQTDDLCYAKNTVQEYLNH